ncbi:hypothetical protein DB41_AU00070 [Neochlamydia sp. TUME1]|nr:hypothetical protein DB41_AU00070 [Neochlamydia sp. TUME1]
MNAFHNPGAHPFLFEAFAPTCCQLGAERGHFSLSDRQQFYI